MVPQEFRAFVLIILLISSIIIWTEAFFVLYDSSVKKVLLIPESLYAEHASEKEDL